MAFLFKSKKQQGLPAGNRNLTSADGSNPPSAVNNVASKDADKSRMAGQPPVAPMNPGMIARGATPDQMALQQQQSRNGANPPQRPPPDMSLYPWSQRRIEFASPNQNPFPRYGAATNSLASPKGDIYLMGGLIEGLMVKGDLWTVEAGSGPYSCNPVATASEGPGPRVGHRALLVGNAFIVFGGDTKIEDNDMLDDTLYLLNTSTKHWSRALPAGQRPAGRYGHTLNILGSKIYIFGGQVEDYFFNDLVAFDLNALQQASNRWEILISNTNDGGPPQGQSPPARTNHTMVTWNEKLYLFGGTDGIHWFNDVWSYDPRTNSWTIQDCIGFIPPAREGHAAALVGDVMYVFGGRTKDGNDLGDLSAFRIPSRRWYTFQNMGPSPSPRSGHGMTAHDQFIYVLGGEPSSSPKDPSDLHMIYVLDTTKIRYPPDTSQQSNGVRGGSRRPSITNERSNTPQAQDRSVSRDGHYTNGVSKFHRDGSQDSMTDPQKQIKGPLDNTTQGASYPAGAGSGRAPRIAGAAPPAGPPPGAPPPVAPNQQQPYQNQQQLQSQVNSQQQIQPSRVNGVGRPFASPDGRESPRDNQRNDRAIAQDPNAAAGRVPPDNGSYRQLQSRDRTASPTPLNIPGQTTQRNAPAAETYTSIIPGNPDAGATGPRRANSVQQQQQPQQTARSRYKQQQESPDDSDLNVTGVPGKEDFRTPMEQPSKAFTANATQRTLDSGLGSSSGLSQNNDKLAKELEAAKSKNAWYASELALARKAGHISGSAESPADSRSPTAFAEDDRPMVEALVKMRNELASVQESFSKQQTSAAERISQAERQRDAAISEAVFHKTRFAGKGDRDVRDSDDRTNDSTRRLAVALASQKELQAKMNSLIGELESERKARQLAEESAEIAHSRAADLDTHKQESSSELERLRSELHDAERAAREEAANASEHHSSLRMLQVDKNELNGQLAAVQEEATGHRTIMGTLRDAVNASTEKATVLEKKLEHERRQRESVEEKLAQLKSEHETRVSELDATNRQLQDAEEVAGRHAAEARLHREVVMAGFGKVVNRDSNPQAVNDERVVILQERLEAANALVRKNQEAADHANERVRRAEERIAGLEAYQEQASREGLSMRKQLQAASREAVALHSEKADLQQLLSSEKMDSSALSVQHNALKDLIAERGLDSSAASVRSGGASHDPETASRLRDLESQLESARTAHEEMRTSYAQRESDANRGWEEKLKALDDDYQAAVKYLKGTEKMLSKMKQELHRYKSANKELEDDLTRTRSSPQPPAKWETERTALRAELDAFQSRIQHSQQQLESQMSEARTAAADRSAAQRALTDLQTQSRLDTDQLRAQNSALETRAEEAEQQVQRLLEKVGNSVAHYRRNSQSVNGVPGGVTDDSPERNLHAQPANSSGGVGSLFSNSSNTGTHNRGLSSTSSLGADSNYSIPASSGIDGAHDSSSTANANSSNNGRNSIALDSLASELETLRSHWETTNKNYRSSGQSFVSMTPTARETQREREKERERDREREGTGTPSVPGAFNSPMTDGEGTVQHTERLQDWRRRLDVEDRDDAGRI